MSGRVAPMLDRAAQTVQSFAVIRVADHSQAREIAALKAANAKLQAELDQKREQERKAAQLHEVDGIEAWRLKGGSGKAMQVHHHIALTSQGMHFRDCLK